MAKIRAYLEAYKSSKFDAESTAKALVDADKAARDARDAAEVAESAFAVVLKKKGSVYEPDDDGDGTETEYYSDNGTSVATMVIFGPDTDLVDDGTLPPVPGTHEPTADPLPPATPTPAPDSPTPTVAAPVDGSIS